MMVVVVMMMMWNGNLSFCSYISDYQIPKACSTFIDEYGTEMFRRNLRRNFLLHLVNLCDFGLLRPSTLHRTMAKFFQLCNRLSEILRAVEVPSQSAADGLGNSSVDRAAVAEPCCNQLTSSSSVVLWLNLKLLLLVSWRLLSIGLDVVLLLNLFGDCLSSVIIA